MMPAALELHKEKKKRRQRRPITADAIAAHLGLPVVEDYDYTMSQSFKLYGGPSSSTTPR